LTLNNFIICKDLILIVNGSIEDNKNDTIDDKSYGKWNNQGHPHVPSK
jgi:hypothetical protein